MNNYLHLDRITEKLFGRPQNLKSYKVMRNYLEQLDKDQLNFLLKNYKGLL